MNVTGAEERSEHVPKPPKGGVRKGSAEGWTHAVTHLGEEGEKHGDQPQWKGNSDGVEKGPGITQRAPDICSLAWLPAVPNKPCIFGFSPSLGWTHYGAAHQ